MHTTGDIQNLEFVKWHSSILYFTKVVHYVMSFSMFCACNDNKKQWQWSNNRIQIKINISNLLVNSHGLHSSCPWIIASGCSANTVINVTLR